ncbi:MAG: aspartate carbamoyltransferase regulatory subunit [Euryarchaeota archaeon]|nr:aspartate carbamoyltransferase regulatory subunit [Euryarchaeota archaeon]
MDKDMKLPLIENGSVIDHIDCGMAIKVLRILGLTSGEPEQTVTVLIKAASRKRKWKDIVKVEGKELKPREVNQIALVAPHATINIIRNHTVVKKITPALPDDVKGIVKCTNLSCISNLNEPIEPSFKVECREPVKLRCHYCDRVVEDPGSHLIE